MAFQDAPAASPVVEYSEFEKHFPTDPSGHLYYFKFHFNGNNYWKIGFTKHNSVKERFSFDGSEDHHYISKVLHFEYYEDAFDLEQKLHSFLHPRRARPYQDKYFPFVQNGQSEIYSTDVLGLDKDLTDREKELKKREDQDWSTYSLEDESPSVFNAYLETFFNLFKNGDSPGRFLLNCLIAALLIVCFPLLFGISLVLKYSKAKEEKRREKWILSVMPNYYELQRGYHTVKRKITKRYLEVLASEMGISIDDIKGSRSKS